jgi:hypothetical protein
MAVPISLKQKRFTLSDSLAVNRAGDSRIARRRRIQAAGTDVPRRPETSRATLGQSDTARPTPCWTRNLFQRTKAA